MALAAQAAAAAHVPAPLVSTGLPPPGFPPAPPPVHAGASQPVTFDNFDSALTRSKVFQNIASYVNDVKGGIHSLGSGFSEFRNECKETNSLLMSALGHNADGRGLGGLAQPLDTLGKGKGKGPVRTARTPSEKSSRPAGLEILSDNEDDLHDVIDSGTAAITPCRHPIALLEAKVSATMHTHLCKLLGISASTKVPDLTKMYVAATVVPLALGEWWRLASRAKDRKQWAQTAGREPRRIN